MPKFRKHIFLFLFLTACAIYTQAQDTVTTDTTYYTDEEMDTASESASREIWIDSIATAPGLSAHKIPDSVLQQLKHDDDFWYADQTPQRGKGNVRNTGSRNFLFSKWFGQLMWILMIICFIAALIWFLSSSNIRLFRKRPVSIPGNDEIVQEENIFDIDYSVEIKKAVQRNEFSTAVRLHYLQLLYLLSQRNMISYASEKTNHQYVDQLFKTPYYKDFSRLTRHFEYSIYGHLPVSESVYKIMQQEFQQFKQQLGA